MQLWTHESLDIGFFKRTIVWSWTHENFSCVHDQTIVRSKQPMSRLSCVQNCICPDYRAFKIAYVQTIVRSKLHMSRLSCVQNCICPDYRAFKIAYVQTIVRSKLHMSRLSCVQNCICPDYRAFIFFSRPCNFERTTPPCAFISVWTYRLSVWHLNMGRNSIILCWFPSKIIFTSMTGERLALMEADESFIEECLWIEIKF